MPRRRPGRSVRPFMQTTLRCRALKPQPSLACNVDGKVSLPGTQARFEVEGAVVAQQLGLEVPEFRRMMESGRIVVLCERGVGDDTGTYRASFYFGKRRARLVLDHRGRVISVES